MNGRTNKRTEEEEIKNNTKFSHRFEFPSVFTLSSALEYIIIIAVENGQKNNRKEANKKKKH